jgi:hypothetical protein
LAVTDADAFSQQLASFHATVDAVFVEYVRHVIEIGALGQFLFVFSYHVISAADAPRSTLRRARCAMH